MSANNSASEGGQDKSLPETTVQSVPQNLTTIQSIQTVQSIQSVQNAGSIQSIQTSQAVAGQAPSLVGKSISLELNSKLLMKQSIPANIGASSENSKITTSTFCPVPGSTVRIIAPNMLSTIERQGQSQVQQTTQQTQQIVTSIPSTYHVPRGPAAVANISTPRATVATPLVRTINTGQPIPISRPGSPVYDEPKLHRPQPYNKKCVASTKGSKASLIAIDLRKQTTSKIRNPTKCEGPRGSAEVIQKPIVNSIELGIQLPLPSVRTGVSTTAASTAQWQSKTTSVVYATQPQRHPVPVVNRPPTRPVATAVYTSQQQPQPQQQQHSQQARLVTPSQVGVGRPVQATVVTATPSRLIAPVLQAQNNNITRLPAPARPPTPQVVTSIPQVSQAAGRSVAQTIQPNQTSRPIASAPINRIAVSAPVIGASNRVATVTSVQTGVGRQLTINTAAGTSTGTVSRIVIPQQALQQQQQHQQQQQGNTRVVQTVTPLANFSQVSRVIATTSTNAGVAANVTRVAQTGPTSVARITGMSLHPLPLTPARVTPTPLKVTAQTPGIQTVQLKQASTSMQAQSQAQPQQLQQQQGPTLQRTIGSVNNANAIATSVASQQSQQVQGQYLHPPHTTTYYSIETSGSYSQYRQTSVQPVRLLVEQGFEEPHGKPNASPRPSILRKREHDNSPGKGVAKNLVPVLASLPAASSASSPPGSPKGERDNGGNHSSGSTTVSATSSPGLDEEPEQSRITINPTVEMSPRKKPRKQQLTGVELTESRCHDEEMQFITEEKIKKEMKEEKEKYGERKSNNSNLQQDLKAPQQPAVKPKPTCSMIDASWKKNGSRPQHFKRYTDVKPREERRPTVSEIAGQPHVFQKVNGWKIHHLTSQMDDVAENENTVCDSMNGRLEKMESVHKDNQDEATIEKINELMKGIMQRNRLVAEGMAEAKTQLHGVFQHRDNVKELLSRNNGNKRTQKKR